MSLKWTSAKPTQEGWYYYRSSRMITRVIKIFTRNARYFIYNDGPMLWAEGKSVNQSLDMLIKYAKHAQFAGPIPEPEEAGE